jgi:hypothetical protein
LSKDCANVPRASSAFGRPWISFGCGTVPPPKKCLSPRCAKPAALMTHWCSLGDTYLPRGSMLLESRSILCRVFPVQCRRLAWMSSFLSRDFTRGMLACCRWYHRVTKVCSSASGARRISTGVVMPRAWAGGITVSRNCVVALLARGALVLAL